MKKYNKLSEYSYALGITVTIELLKTCPEYVSNVYVHSKYQKKDNIIEELCSNYNIPIVQNDAVFRVLSDKENCYVIGEFKKYDGRIFEGMHIVLVNPSNAGNLGTIIRSAVGFGIYNIAIISPAVDIFDPKVVRASMGAVFHINSKYYDSFDDYLHEFSGKKIYPFMLGAKTKINEVVFDNSASLVFGPEASGLPNEYLKIGTPLIIPISNNIDSLNLPIAVSIACYEATKNNFNYFE